MIATIIVGAREIFPDYKIPENIESVVSTISKETILFELAGLNYQLKPKDRVETDSSIQTQRALFEHYCSTENLLKKYLKAMDAIQKKHTDKDVFGKAIFFNRQACLYGIELLLNSEVEFNEQNRNMSDGNNWEKYLLFLSLLNTAVSDVRPNTDSPDFEELNALMLPLNDISIESDIFYEPIRGFELIKYLAQNEDIGDFVEQFFIEKYGVEYPMFFKNIVSLYLGKKNSDKRLEFTFIAEENTRILEELSKRVSNENIFDLLSIKVGPLNKCDFKDRCYYILDSMFLLERSYTILINDLWFNGLKTKEVNGKKIPIREYKGLIGLFIESYIEETLNYSFQKERHIKLFTFDDLKVIGRNKDEELADFYIRRDNKICIGQLKSTTINTIQRTSADITELYKNDRRKFYDTHGMKQIITSIIHLDSISEVDKGYKVNSRKDIYPVILVTDKIFQTPLISNQFNDEFRTRLGEVKKQISDKYKIHHLSLIHITDLELLSNNFHDNPKLFWNVLRHYADNKRLIPPFYSSANKFLTKPPIERLMKFFSQFLE
jgi:hypothetical protein